MQMLLNSLMSDSNSGLVLPCNARMSLELTSLHEAFNTSTLEQPARAAHPPEREERHQLALGKEPLSV